MNPRSIYIPVLALMAIVLSLASWTVVTGHRVYGTIQGWIIDTLHQGFPVWFYTPAGHLDHPVGRHWARLLLNTTAWFALLLAFASGWRFIRSRRRPA